MNQKNEFLHRHIGPSERDYSAMLQSIGVQSLDELIDEAIPESLRTTTSLQLPLPKTEAEALETLQTFAQKNIVKKSFLGQGYYNTFLPPPIQRMILENPGWYTSYTPYQAEISQGRLEALLNFQTMICDMTKMEVANASLLDEGTAAAEAMMMAYGLAKKDSKSPRKRFFVSAKCFRQTIDVMITRGTPHGIELVVGDAESVPLDSSFFGALVQYPDDHGAVIDFSGFIQKVHDAGALAVVATDLLSLDLLTPPGEYGADVVVGNAQRFGLPLGYGGPHAAFFATRQEFIRSMPGRIIGVSIDAENHTAYRMTLQTREQHIRREKATSNICTAQALLAIMAGMYAVYHGAEGIHEIAERTHKLTKVLEKALTQIGFRQLNPFYFDTLRIETQNTKEAEEIIRRSSEKGYNLRFVEDKYIGISLDETATIADVENLVHIFASVRKSDQQVKSFQELYQSAATDFPPAMTRRTPYLQHPVFQRYHSETAFMRYVKSLENKDISLTSSMIPLGSCTMKLNAAVEMLPLTWKEFANIHPFVPREQARGYEELIEELGKALCFITGFAGITFQPNSGAQGEFTGLSIIRAYLQDHNQPQRNVVLIPASAHGTNPASAVMAGYEVVVVQCDEHGNIDSTDLRKKTEEYKDTLAAFMVTYPSTHGVFEENIKELCKVVHQAGGLVYMDGANLNAQVGFLRPAELGADVCHINLHKTFAIPHGGGGPGMGPVCVSAQLMPYLPGYSVTRAGSSKSISAVASAPFGSANILIISYAYISLLGADGLREATKYALLNANYLKSCLEPYYPILFQGARNRVAHEFILNLKPLKESTGIEAEDVAKRLMDYGFHAPTVSFPVAGTLMVEPTESEPKEELDRFIAAMIAIRKEIQAIADGNYSREDNPLKNAPHTATVVCASQWQHCYPREVAAFPLPYLNAGKYWPPVSRINNTYGDRNILCVCPPIESTNAK